MRRLDEIRTFRLDEEIARKKASIFALEQEVNLQKIELKDLTRRRDEFIANHSPKEQAQ